MSSGIPGSLLNYYPLIRNGEKKENKNWKSDIGLNGL